MKVFRVKSDVNHYQWLMPDIPETELLNFLTFDCCPRQQDWRSPPIYPIDPELAKGDFLHITPEVLLANPMAARKVRSFFERAGELLPLWYDGDEYMLLNITTCGDVLDPLTTDWLTAGDGSRVEITRYGFDERKLPESSLFKIPEMRKASVFTWERDKNPDREFKAYVEENLLSGLLFEEIWDSEKGIG